ncbi:MAG: metallophosphoesterase [Candidatus Bathyarchaeota archaeon]|nr:metallophosphoesterase [Candidatus Bathyarchaeota archaeon]
MTQIKPMQAYPALILQKNNDRALVVADLHIGWERLLSQRGVHVPSQTPKIKNMMLRLIKECKPTRVIFLGDVKDAIAKVEMEEWRDIPNFFEDIQTEVSDIQVILGNHDGNLEPLLPENVKIIPPTGISFGDVGLFHGHAWPAPELLECRSLVTGHVHPTVAIRDPMGFRMTRQVLVKAPCDGEQLAKSLLNHLGAKKNNNNLSAVLEEQYKVKLNVSQLFIMPAFNQFLGGRPINERKRGKKKTGVFIGPILRSGCVNIDDAEVYLLDGTFLGTVDQLKALS